MVSTLRMYRHPLSRASKLSRRRILARLKVLLVVQLTLEQFVHLTLTKMMSWLALDCSSRMQTSRLTVFSQELMELSGRSGVMRLGKKLPWCLAEVMLNKIQQVFLHVQKRMAMISLMPTEMPLRMA